MNIHDAILFLFNNLISTLLAIIAAAAFIGKVKPAGSAIKRFIFGELYAANEKQDKRLDNLEMQQLKQIICDRRLPIGERLNAGKAYTGRGGNGEILMIYESLHEAAKQERLKEQERFEQEEMKNRRSV
jgi:hypothetical protein